LLDFACHLGGSSQWHYRQHEGTIMAWKKPTVTEIALGAEINSYACADLKR